MTTLESDAKGANPIDAKKYSSLVATVKGHTASLR